MACPTEGDIVDAEFMNRFASELLVAAGLSPSSSKLPAGEKLVTFVKRSLLSFLRSAALLFHFLTNISPPSLLREANSSEDLDPETEFNILAGYLGLSHKMHDLLDPSLRQLSLSWVKHPRVHLLASNAVVQNKSPTEIPLKLISQPHDVNHLIVLPKDYSELINSVSNFTCPNSDLEDSRSPTMCLVCGTMLCSQSYCCQTELEGQMVGACTYHTHFCGAGVGIFLRIRDCKVLLLAGKSKGQTSFLLLF
jgi:E3 ubiquitin-protein ligase UBR2